MNEVSGEKMMHVLHNPLFPQVDQMLRRGAHIGEEDVGQYDFVHDCEEYLAHFYGLYQGALAKTAEGTYYLHAADSSLFPAKTLSRLDMVVGKTLAAMLLEPDILTTLGRVSVDKLLQTMELNPGRATLLALTSIKAKDEEQANDKFRESLSKTLYTLHSINVLKFNAKDAEILPFKAIMRFADDVRTGAGLDDNLAQHVAAGCVVRDTTHPDTSADNDSNDDQDRAEGDHDEA